MSNFDYKDCTLTYFVEHISYMFEDEVSQIVNRAISKVVTNYALAITPTITRLEGATDRRHANIKYIGYYCVVIFESDEDRAYFKLAVPSHVEFHRRISEVMHEL